MQGTPASTSPACSALLARAGTLASGASVRSRAAGGCAPRAARGGPHCHDRQRAAQVWRVLEQALALMQRLEHQLELAPGLRGRGRRKCLFQVAHAAVHLRAGAAFQI